MKEYITPELFRHYTEIGVPIFTILKERLSVAYTNGVDNEFVLRNLKERFIEFDLIRSDVDYYIKNNL